MSQVTERRDNLTPEEKALWSRVCWRRSAAAGAGARPPLFEAQAARTPGRDRRRAPASDPHLPRAQRARQPARPPPPRPRRRARGARRPLHSSARRRCSSACSASSRPAAPTCRSTRPTRPSGSPSCSTTRGARLLVTEDALRGRCPARSTPASSASTPTAAAIAAGAATRDPDRRRRTGEPRLRDLHLGLDRHAQGRAGHAPRRSANFLAVDARPARRSTTDDALLAVTDARRSTSRRSSCSCR